MHCICIFSYLDTRCCFSSIVESWSSGGLTSRRHSNVFRLFCGLGSGGQPVSTIDGSIVQIVEKNIYWENPVSTLEVTVAMQKQRSWVSGIFQASWTRCQKAWTAWTRTNTCQWHLKLDHLGTLVMKLCRVSMPRKLGETLRKWLFLFRFTPVQSSQI